ncbi:MAG: hypothetical protein JW717_09350 [Marinilabiliaceae bacterium]|nr:hypothetical protein [Marinilabiliaceae bacterium]
MNALFTSIAGLLFVVLAIVFIVKNRSRFKQNIGYLVSDLTEKSEKINIVEKCESDMNKYEQNMDSLKETLDKIFGGK